MSIRILIAQHKPWVALASVAAIAIGLVAMRRVHQENQLSGMITQAYFSDDDGKSYFAEAIENGVEFVHNGKPAYRAYVFRCETDKPFVGFLGRNSGGGIEIRKPGESKWVPIGSVEGEGIIRSLCPSGSPEPVMPD